MWGRWMLKHVQHDGQGCPLSVYTGKKLTFCKQPRNNDASEAFCALLQS